MDFTLLRDYCGQSVEGWFLSPKRDGWRAWFDGRQFITRGGHVLRAPEWFLAGMPDVPLDGELWLGPGQFWGTQRALANGWHGLTFQVFDAPSHGGRFRARLAFLKSLSLPAHVQVVPQIRCEGTRHLVEFAHAEVMRGGEGAVVRDGRAFYQPGRSDSILRWVPVPPEVNRRRVA